MLGEDLLDVPLDCGRAPPGLGSNAVDGFVPGQHRRHETLHGCEPGDGLQPLRVDPQTPRTV